MNKLEHALRLIGRRLIGGYGSNKSRPSESKYMPHQGEREIARRQRNAAKKAGA